jgi:thioredoxin-like negative regulator of GroEL
MTMPAATTINSDKDFNDALSDRSGKIALFFTASWSAPAKTMAVAFDEVVGTTSGIRGYVVDVDLATDSAATFSVRTVPMLVLLNGAKTTMLPGAQSRENIRSFLGDG